MPTQTAPPEIHLSITDPARRQQVETAIRERLTANGITNPAEVSDIAQFGKDGITLRLNQAEGMMLFKDDALLDKQLHLFDGGAPHTSANLKAMNDKLAAYGVSVSRQPPLDAEFAAIVAKADEHIRQTTIHPPTATSFDEVYANHQVTVVGERHTEQSARMSIAAKLPELAATGGALVMEGIPANRQAMLNAYLAAPTDATIPPLLKASLAAHTGDERMLAANPDYYSAERLLVDAKKAGVPVYAFDSDATLLVNYGAIMKGGGEQGKYSLPVENSEQFTRANPLDYRLITMNEQAREIIADLQAKHGKIVVNVGGAHALPENGVPGLGDLVGGGQLIIRDGTQPGSVISHEVNKEPGFPFEIERGDSLTVTANPDELKQRLATIEATPKALRGLPSALEQSVASTAESPSGKLYSDLGEQHTALLATQNSGQADAETLARLGDTRRQIADLSWKQGANGEPVNPNAVSVEQGEVGFSVRQPIGTDNINDCIGVIIRDPVTHKTAVAHIDGAVDEASYQRIMDGMPQRQPGAPQFEVKLIGARFKEGDEAHPFNIETSKQNIQKVMNFLEGKDVRIVAVDIHNGDQPIAFVVDPETFRVTAEVPGQAYGDVHLTNGRVSIGGSNKPLEQVFDLTVSPQTQPHSQQHVQHVSSEAERGISSQARPTQVTELAERGFGIFHALPTFHPEENSPITKEGQQQRVRVIAALHPSLSTSSFQEGIPAIGKPFGDAVVSVLAGTGSITSASAMDNGTTVGDNGSRVASRHDQQVTAEQLARTLQSTVPAHDKDYFGRAPGYNELAVEGIKPAAIVINLDRLLASDLEAAHIATSASPTNSMLAHTAAALKGEGNPVGKHGGKVLTEGFWTEFAHGVAASYEKASQFAAIAPGQDLPIYALVDGQLHSIQGRGAAHQTTLHQARGSNPAATPFSFEFREAIGRDSALAEHIGGQGKPLIDRLAPLLAINAEATPLRDVVANTPELTRAMRAALAAEVRPAFKPDYQPIVDTALESLAPSEAERKAAYETAEAARRRALIESASGQEPRTVPPPLPKSAIVPPPLPASVTTVVQSNNALAVQPPPLPSSLSSGSQASAGATITAGSEAANNDSIKMGRADVVDQGNLATNPAQQKQPAAAPQLQSGQTSQVAQPNSVAANNPLQQGQTTNVSRSQSPAANDVHVTLPSHIAAEAAAAGAAIAAGTVAYKEQQGSEAAKPKTPVKAANPPSRAAAAIHAANAPIGVAMGAHGLYEKLGDKNSNYHQDKASGGARAAMANVGLATDAANVGLGVVDSAHGINQAVKAAKAATVTAQVAEGATGALGVAKTIAGRAAIPLAVVAGAAETGAAIAAKDGHRAATAVGSTVGGIAAGIGTAMATGALMGSIVPGAGTVVGAAVGLVTGIGGALLGGWLGGKGADAVAGDWADKQLKTENQSRRSASPAAATAKPAPVQVSAQISHGLNPTYQPPVTKEARTLH